MQVVNDALYTVDILVMSYAAALLAELKEKYYFFNKPKGSVYCANHFESKTSLLKEFDVLIDIYSQIKSRLYAKEIPKAVIIDCVNSAGYYIEDFNPIYQQIPVNIQKASREIYLIYAESNAVTENFYVQKNNLDNTRVKFEQCIGKIFKEFKNNSPIFAHLFVGSVVEHLKIGNCGDYCSYIAAKLIREHYINTKELLNVELIQANFVVNKSVLFSHCFLVVNGRMPFSSSSLKELGDAYYIDAWNFAYLRANQLDQNNSKELAYLKFIIKNLKLFELGFSLSTYHHTEMLPLDEIMNQAVNIPTNYTNDCQLLNNEIEQIKGQLN